MYKLFFIALLSLSLSADDTKPAQTEELFKYSSLTINDNVSFYAAEVYMNNIEEENTYSVGLLLHAENRDDAEFGMGYMKVSQENAFSYDISKPLETEGDDGILFFMNYKF